MNTPILYFAYGSNLNPKRITRRCPTAATFRTAKLRNYRLVERLYADIDYEEGAVVHGVLYCISERELSVLDTYEGCPRIYRRIWIEAECNGENFVAATYEMTPETKILRAGQPFPEDYRKICSAGAAYHRIPNAFRNNKNFFHQLNLKRSTKK